jgi:hypothetical protein
LRRGSHVVVELPLVDLVEDRQQVGLRQRNSQTRRINLFGFKLLVVWCKVINKTEALIHGSSAKDLIVVLRVIVLGIVR